MSSQTTDNFAFYEQLYRYYQVNRRKIRSRYNDLTRKFLAYNDRDVNAAKNILDEGLRTINAV